MGCPYRLCLFLFVSKTSVGNIAGNKWAAMQEQHVSFSGTTYIDKQVQQCLVYLRRVTRLAPTFEHQFFLEDCVEIYIKALLDKKGEKWPKPLKIYVRTVALIF